MTNTSFERNVIEDLKSQQSRVRGIGDFLNKSMLYNIGNGDLIMREDRHRRTVAIVNLIFGYM